MIRAKVTVELTTDECDVDPDNKIHIVSVIHDTTTEAALESASSEAARLALAAAVATRGPRPRALATVARRLTAWAR